MRILILDSCYQEFLDEHYASNPGLERETYRRQWRSLMDTCFGTADFYSRNLTRLGHEATEIVTNCAPLQMQWGLENGFRAPLVAGERRLGRWRVPWPRRGPWFYPLLMAQIINFQPDVIHIQNPNAMPASFLREIRAALKNQLRTITAQIASPRDPSTDFTQYDLMLSSFPHFVEDFRREGIRSEHFRLGFGSEVLKHLKPTEPQGAVFVGGISPAHADRLDFFERLAELCPFDWWGYGLDKIDPDSPMKQMWRGEAWGNDMYQRLYDAKISLNHHVDVAKNYANNMRLYEATGVGSMLLTDAKEGLENSFDPGHEIETYRSVEECAEKIQYYLGHEMERRSIAQAGKARTASDHTYFKRMQEYLKLIKPLT